MIKHWPSRDRGVQSERTSIAWTRTALAVTVNALLVLRVGLSTRSVAFGAIGVMLLLASAAISVYGSHRQHRMAADETPEAVPVPVMAFISGVAFVASVVAIAGICRSS